VGFSLAFRDELLATDWPDSERVAARLGVSPQNAAAIFSDCAPRASFSVCGASRAGAMSIRISSSTATNVRGRTLQRYCQSCRTEAQKAADGIARGGSPADVFADDPKRVIDAAIDQFRQSRDVEW
jgi:hypothetical protein